MLCMMCKEAPFLLKGVLCCYQFCLFKRRAAKPKGESRRSNTTGQKVETVNIVFEFVRLFAALQQGRGLRVKVGEGQLPTASLCLHWQLQAAP
eukprot:2772672-Amphidinium_carterae.1